MNKIKFKNPATETSKQNVQATGAKGTRNGFGQTKPRRIKQINMPSSHNWHVWFVLFVLFCVAVYVLRSVLMPFVAGIVLGYLFDPLASRFEKWGMSRTWATILVFAVVILIAVPAIILFFPQELFSAAITTIKRNENIRIGKKIKSHPQDKKTSASAALIPQYFS